MIGRGVFCFRGANNQRSKQVMKISEAVELTQKGELSKALEALVKHDLSEVREPGEAIRTAESGSSSYRTAGTLSAGSI